MSTPSFISPPAPAELPDWILALKPPDADVAPVQTEESAVFIGLDAELDLLARTAPDDIAWLAEIVDQPPPLISSTQAASILEGEVRPTPAMRPPRRKRRRKMRATDLFVLDLMLCLMILAILGLAFVLKFVLGLF
jgi:hypothetical protein